MSQPDVPETVPAPPPRRRRRWLKITALVLLPLIGVPLVAYGIYGVIANRELAAAVAEADRLDPGWRLADLEARRRKVPAKENSAERVLAVRKLTPREWPAGKFVLTFTEPPPEVQLNDRQVAALRAELARVKRALSVARKLADYPDGRYPITYSPDFLSTRSSSQEARAAAAMLQYDALLRGQDGDADGALDDCRGMLNAGRSIGDEPLIVSQLVRLSCRALAVEETERALAQGEPSEAALAAAQKLLEKEEPERLLWVAARGSRAGQDQFMEALKTGEAKFPSDRELRLTAGLAGKAKEGPSFLELLLLRLPPGLTRQRAALLRFWNPAVEAARLPPRQWPAEFARLEATLPDQPLFVRLLVPALGRVAPAFQRSRAQLGCALVALAVERYRRRHGHWPDTLAALVPAQLSQVPADPYDGRPLRFRRLGDGAVVYSVGPDGKDDGGTIDRHDPLRKGADVGFRLWDVAKRRQPPQPKPAEPPGE